MDGGGTLLLPILSQNMKEWPESEGKGHMVL